MSALLFSCNSPNYYRDGSFSSDELDSYIIEGLPTPEDIGSLFVQKYNALLSCYGTVDDLSVFDAYGGAVFSFLTNSENITFVGYFGSEEIFNPLSAVASSSLQDFRNDFPAYSFYYTNSQKESGVVHGFRLVISLQPRAMQIDLVDGGERSANFRIVLGKKSFEPVILNN